MHRFNGMRSQSILIIAALLVPLAGCIADQSVPSADGQQGAQNVGACPSSAAQDLTPGKQVVEQKCNSCHSFDPNNFGSGAFGRITDGSMPPNNPLSAAEVEQVRALVACSSGGGSTGGGGDEDEDGEGEGDD